ncbi:MAG: nucleoside hydrolase [Myxococcota bacterium]|nr:nucleoside hydrolase [Myxococcota bacterium]
MRIWIDTDPALGYSENGHPRDVDDAFLIVEAIRDPGIEVVGITSVSGNSPAKVGFEVASDLVSRTGSNIPVLEGASLPGSETDGFVCDAAVEAMAAALRAGPLALVAIGPLTNVAALIQHHPEVVSNIETCVVVAGRSVDQVFAIHGATGIPDFNFEFDPHAGRVLMESEVPVVYVGFELTSQVVVTAPDLESARGRSSIGDLLIDGALPWIEWWTGVFPADTGFHPWDSAALAYLKHPEWFESEQRGWRIQNSPPGSPGAPETPWLELGRDLPGKRSTYCSGFTAGGAEAFVEGIVEAIR